MPALVPGNARFFEMFEALNVPSSFSFNMPQEARQRAIRTEDAMSAGHTDVSDVTHRVARGRIASRPQALTTSTAPLAVVTPPQKGPGQRLSELELEAHAHGTNAGQYLAEIPKRTQSQARRYIDPFSPFRPAADL